MLAEIGYIAYNPTHGLRNKEEHNLLANLSFSESIILLTISGIKLEHLIHHSNLVLPLQKSI